MSNFTILEVVSGLGMGGAEKILIARLKYQPIHFRTLILNIRPEIDELVITSNTSIHKVLSKGISRLIETWIYFRNTQVDVVVVRTPLDAVRFSFLKIVCAKPSVKLVFEVHSNFISTYRWASILLSVSLFILRSQIDIHVAVSMNVSEGPLCRWARIVHIVYCGSEMRVLSSDMQPPNHAKLLFVGRLIPLKRPIWLLQRFQKVCTMISIPDSSLTIVGSGQLEGEVNSYISENKLQQKVTFVGAQEDVTPFYAEATHLVSCSTNEGLPMTFFEAKLAGMYIVATPSGGGIEIMQDEDTALASFDENEFEEALLRILTSPPPSISERRMIQEKCAWMSAEHGSQQFYGVLSALVNNPN